MRNGETILVSLSSNIVVGNFSMPGGVFARLAKIAQEQNIKVVYFVAPIFQEKIIECGNNPNIIFENIEKFLPKTFLEKVFYFFYSYLIFTGTTRLLATFGARADTPPAGGNRHLFFIKAIIAKTFGRSVWLKRSGVPFLYKHIFTKRPHKQLFDKYDPDLVFVPNIAFFPDIELVAEAKRRSIRSVGMAQNWDHLNKYFIPQHSDILLLQNKPMAREAVELHGYEEKQIKIVGFPQFDIYADLEKYIWTRQRFEKEFNIVQNRKIILHISGSIYAMDEQDILSRIVDWMDSDSLPQKAHLLVRPYVSKRDIADEKQKYTNIEHRAGVSFNWQLGERSKDTIEQYVNMIYHADVIISVFSTTAIEAGIFDKPTIIIGFDGDHKRAYHRSIARLEHLSHFQHVLNTGSVNVVRSFKELNQSLVSALEHPEQGHEARKNLVDKMCFKIDGLAYNRVVEELIS
jgi:CDP-glycerol glycerophosphotransferase (TagB/SpsB family)